MFTSFRVRCEIWQQWLSHNAPVCGEKAIWTILSLLLHDRFVPPALVPLREITCAHCAATITFAISHGRRKWREQPLSQRSSMSRWRNFGTAIIGGNSIAKIRFKFCRSSYGVIVFAIAFGPCDLLGPIGWWCCAVEISYAVFLCPFL